MRDGKPRPKLKPKDGPTEISKAAGCSKGLASSGVPVGWPADTTPDQRFRNALTDAIAESEARRAVDRKNPLARFPASNFPDYVVPIPGAAL
jgi:hypothetical protein